VEQVGFELSTPIRLSIAEIVLGFGSLSCEKTISSDGEKIVAADSPHLLYLSGPVLSDRESQAANGRQFKCRQLLRAQCD